jgi:hypothetical protein
VLHGGGGPCNAGPRGRGPWGRQAGSRRAGWVGRLECISILLIASALRQIFFEPRRKYYLY